MFEDPRIVFLISYTIKEFIKAYYIIRKAEKKNSFSLFLLSLCIYKAKHNDLNYVLCTLIEDEEAFSCRSRQCSRKCYSNRDSQVEERMSK